MQPVFAAFITQVIRVGEEAAFVKVEYFFLGEGAELDESAAEVDEVFHGVVFVGESASCRSAARTSNIPARFRRVGVFCLLKRGNFGLSGQGGLR